MPIPLIILFVLIILAIIWFMFPVGYTTETVVVDSTNDPMMKAIAEHRTALVNNVICALADAWRIVPDDIKVKIEQLSFDVSLITLIYQNHMFRLYCNWKRNIMRLNYTTNHDGKSSVQRKKVKINASAVDLEELYMFFTSIKPADTEEKVFAMPEKAIAALIETTKELRDSEKLTHEDVNSMLIESWDEVKELIEKQGTQELLMQFSAITSFLYEYCPEEFKKHLEEIKEQKESAE